MLHQRLQEVDERIVRACGKCGRSRKDVTLIAVTKVFPADRILQAYELGLRHFGENYVQEFEGKWPQVSHLRDAKFHLIGHLQSNKSNKAADLFHCIQTVDTPKLARRLNGAAKPLDVMVEVKLSPEESKHGTAPEDLRQVLDAIRDCSNLNLLGLMTMPPWSEEPELSRPYFRRLRELAVENSVDVLSMGMSHDLEVAIEEGATHIRVGTALFGRRKRA